MAATPLAPSLPARVSQPRPVGEVAAVLRTDTALRHASDRKYVTRDEALGLLADVHQGIRDPARAAAAATVVDDVAVACHHRTIVGRDVVVDALLDVRLVMSGEEQRKGGDHG